MTHTESQELLLDLAYGELPAHVAVEVEEHLAGCAECQKAKSQLEGVRKAFAPIRESEEPGVGFDERILAASRAEAQLEHDGNIGEVIEVAATVAPSGLDAARIDAHAASVAPAPARARPKWMTRAVLGGSIAAAAALALVVSTSQPARREQKPALSDYEIHVVPQSQSAPPPEPRTEPANAVAANDKAVQPAPAMHEREEAERQDRRRVQLAAKKSNARAIDEGSGGDVPDAAPAATAAAPAGAVARTAAPAAPAPAGAAPAPAGAAPAPPLADSSQAPASALATAAEDAGEMERRASAARHAGNYALAAGLYRGAASGRENDPSAAAWDLAHAVECLAAAGSFDEARKVRDQLRKSYPGEATAFSAARRALREVDPDSPAKY
jgi:hypothetical protein